MFIVPDQSGSEQSQLSLEKKRMTILFITTVILKTTRETQSLCLLVKFNICIYKVELVTVEKIMAMAIKSLEHAKLSEIHVTLNN